MVYEYLYEFIKVQQLTYYEVKYDYNQDWLKNKINYL